MFRTKEYVRLPILVVVEVGADFCSFETIGVNAACVFADGETIRVTGTATRIEEGSIDWEIYLDATRYHRVHQFVAKQSHDLADWLHVGIANVLMRHHSCAYLTGLRVHRQMDLAPGASLRIAVLAYLPLAIAEYLQPVLSVTRCGDSPARCASSTTSNSCTRRLSIL